MAMQSKERIKGIPRLTAIARKPRANKTFKNFFPVLSLFVGGKV
jgi:hypothetical protein